MNSKIKSNTLSTGLAMFSMFFGAGNIVYPLAVGQYAQDQNFYGILGLLITAVGVPFVGLMAMTLFDGNHKHFFDRIGKVPGFLIGLLIMALIGPFGAMPRLFALSYSTIKIFVPSNLAPSFNSMGSVTLPLVGSVELSLVLFSVVSCALVYFLTFRRGRILDILGYFLTPILLVSLLVLIIKGIFSSGTAVPAEDSALSTFLFGLQEGYNTMDLMGAFFFSSVVIVCLKEELHPESKKGVRELITMTLKAGCIGASLLGIVYVGSSYVAALNSETLATIPREEVLAILALQILGPYGGIFAIAAVTMSCLTTAIALAAVFAEYLHEDITMMKLGYKPCLIFTMIATLLMSMLNFSGIMGFLSPILAVCYPALIMLSIVNLLHKFYGFKPVKTPFFVVLLISLIVYLW